MQACGCQGGPEDPRALRERGGAGLTVHPASAALPPGHMSRSPWTCGHGRVKVLPAGTGEEGAWPLAVRGLVEGQWVGPWEKVPVTGPGCGALPSRADSPGQEGEAEGRRTHAAPRRRGGGRRDAADTPTHTHTHRHTHTQTHTAALKPLALPGGPASGTAPSTSCRSHLRAQNRGRETGARRAAAAAGD